MHEVESQWLAQRKKGIGGSDVGAILGLNPYRSRMDVWLDKTGRGGEVADNYAMARGRAMEPFLRQAFCNQTGLTVQVTENHTVAHRKYPFLRASYDGITSDDGVLEIKTMNEWVAKKGEIPKTYYWQIQHYMFIAELNHGYFAIDAAGRFIVEPVEYDPAYEVDVLPELIRFWQDYVRADQHPPVQKRDNIPPTIDDKVQADDQTVNAYQALKEVKAAIKRLEEDKERYEDLLLQQMDGRTSLVDASGRVIATHKAITSVRFDSKSFKADHADLYEQYKKPTTFNRLTIK